MQNAIAEQRNFENIVGRIRLDARTQNSSRIHDEIHAASCKASHLP
jgi:hypothetical protein